MARTMDSLVEIRALLLRFNIDRLLCTAVREASQRTQSVFDLLEQNVFKAVAILSLQGHFAEFYKNDFFHDTAFTFWLFISMHLLVDELCLSVTDALQQRIKHLRRGFVGEAAADRTVRHLVGHAVCCQHAASCAL